MAALPKTKMNVQQFFDWWDAQEGEERFELVDGVVVPMGRDRVRHNQAKSECFVALRSAVLASGLNCRVFIYGLGVSGGSRHFRLPDVVINCGDVDPEASLLPNPVALVEVVSPTSEERDVHVKLTEYFAIASVVHDLIVYPERRLLVHHRPTETAGRIDTTFRSDGLLTLDPPGLNVSVLDLLGGQDQLETSR